MNILQLCKVPSTASTALVNAVLIKRALQGAQEIHGVLDYNHSPSCII